MVDLTTYARGIEPRVLPAAMTLHPIHSLSGLVLMVENGRTSSLYTYCFTRKNARTVERYVAENAQAIEHCMRILQRE